MKGEMLMQEYYDAFHRALDFKGVSTKREYWLPFGINILIWLSFFAIFLMVGYESIAILAVLYFIYSI